MSNKELEWNFKKDGIPLLEAKIQPFLEEINKLEKEKESRQKDMIILQHAANDILLQIVKQKDKMKKLPKSELIR